MRENNNAFDPKAIALHFNNKKIGFIPREDNDLLSRLIDADVVPLHAEITHLNKEAREWENVHIGVYVQKETNEPVATNARYLTVLETPKYRTLKINKDEVASIRYENRADEEDIIDADSFYNSITETRKKNKNQPDLIHPFPSGQDLEDLIHEGRIIVNKNKLPKDLQEDKLSYALEEGMISLNDFFNESGYVVANVNEMVKLSNRIETVVDKIDRFGQLFYEINFS